MSSSSDSDDEDLEVLVLFLILYYNKRLRMRRHKRKAIIKDIRKRRTEAGSRAHAEFVQQWVSLSRRNTQQICQKETPTSHQ